VDGVAAAILLQAWLDQHPGVQGGP
jgi:hypothetical protein